MKTEAKFKLKVQNVALWWSIIPAVKNNVCKKLFNDMEAVYKGYIFKALIQCKRIISSFKGKNIYSLGFTGDSSW